MLNIRVCLLHPADQHSNDASTLASLNLSAPRDLSSPTRHLVVS